MQRKSGKYGCVGTGFIVLDVIRHSVGTTTTEKQLAGGSCGNVLTILSYLGWRSSAVGRIGDDQPGRKLVSDLASWEVETAFLDVEPKRGTPVVVQENYIDAGGRPRHRFSRACPTCGAILPGYRPVMLKKADSIAAGLPRHEVFYFDRVAAGTLELARRSRERGALVVFEPSGIKDERLFAGCLEVAHIVKYSRDRLRGVNDAAAKAKVPVEIETLGAKGLRLRVRGRTRAGGWKNLPAFSAPRLVDAAGSGDWTSAGLIHSLVTGGGAIATTIADKGAVERATRLGQALAALNCGFDGARGLMYAADAGHALTVAGKILDGGELTVAEVQAKGGRAACDEATRGLPCSGLRSLHS